MISTLLTLAAPIARDLLFADVPSPKSFDPSHHMYRGEGSLSISVKDDEWRIAKTDASGATLSVTYREGKKCVSIQPGLNVKELFNITGDITSAQNQCLVSRVGTLGPIPKDELTAALALRGIHGVSSGISPTPLGCCANEPVRSEESVEGAGYAGCADALCALLKDVQEVGAAEPTVEPAEPTAEESEARIFNGETPDASHGFLVKLEGSVWHNPCSGTVVARHWVLTAAHCKPDTGTQSYFATTLGGVKRSGGVLMRYAGYEHCWTDVALLPSCHESNDVALVYFAEAFTGVAPIAIADAAPSVGEQLVIAGGGALTDSLKSNQVSVEHIQNEWLTVGVRTDGGDSGGPLFRVGERTTTIPSWKWCTYTTSLGGTIGYPCFEHQRIVVKSFEQVAVTSMSGSNTYYTRIDTNSLDTNANQKQRQSKKAWIRATIAKANINRGRAAPPWFG